MREKGKPISALTSTVSEIIKKNNNMYTTLNSSRNKFDFVFIKN